MMINLKKNYKQDVSSDLTYETCINQKNKLKQQCTLCTKHLITCFI